MSIHVLAGQDAPEVPGPGEHLPTRRPRTYPSDTTEAEWRILALQWDALPVDFPPHPLVKHYFTVWTRDGTLTRIHNSLREQVRQVEGRTPDPSAALLDSQAVRAAETVPRRSRGFDAGNASTAASGTS